MWINKDDHNRYHLNRYHKRRQLILEYLGNVCNSCGSTEKLEVDHVDPNTKCFSISKEWGRPIGELITELDKCQLLCRVCHEKKTWKEKTKNRKHGTWGMYNNAGCRCSECREFVNAYQKARKARKRLASSSSQV